MRNDFKNLAYSSFSDQIQVTTIVVPKTFSELKQALLHLDYYNEAMFQLFCFLRVQRMHFHEIELLLVPQLLSFLI